jgi:hypothetical protein
MFNGTLGPILRDLEVRAMGEVFGLSQEACIALRHRHRAASGEDHDGNSSEQGEGGGRYDDRAALFYRLRECAGDVAWKARTNALVRDLRVNYFEARKYSFSFLARVDEPAQHPYRRRSQPQRGLAKVLGRSGEWTFSPYYLGQRARLGANTESDLDGRIVAAERRLLHRRRRALPRRPLVAEPRLDIRERGRVRRQGRCELRGECRRRAGLRRHWNGNLRMSGARATGERSREHA